MATGKRRAEEDLPRSSRSRPQLAAPAAHLATITTLTNLDCIISVAKMTPENVDNAIGALPRAQQHVDLWTIVQSPNFKSGTTVEPYFNLWRKVRSLTLEAVLEWRQGPLANSLPEWKASGAKVATRAILTCRLLQEQAVAASRVDLEKLFLLKELDYFMLMYAMYLKAIDNMIPDHQVRMAYLSPRLSSSGALVVMTHGTSVAEKGPVQDTIDNNMHELVESFRQSAEARLPEIKGHDDIRQQLDDFFQIPILFGSMIDPTERIGFQTVLFFGPPGTGKTLLARSLASKREMTFFNVASEVLTSKYVGDTEKIIKALADVAKKHKPSIVFIDEIDSLTRQRQSSESSFDRRSKNSLLEMFNEISHEPSIFITGATNRPWDLDPAFLSRFQHKVYLGLPSASDYLEMIGNGLVNKRSLIPGWKIQLLCATIERLTGRDIANAMASLSSHVWTDLMHATSFVPVVIDDQTFVEPCGKDLDSDARVDLPFSEWPVAQLRPRAITYDDLVTLRQITEQFQFAVRRLLKTKQEALKTVTPALTEEELQQYEDWTANFGTRSVRL